MGMTRLSAGRLWRGLRGVAASLRWVAARPAAGLRWLGGLRREAWLVEGEERNSRLPLRVLSAITEAEEEKYLLKLIYAGSYDRRRLGRFWLWRIANAGIRAGCGLIFVETTESHLRLARLRDWFFIPQWLFGEVSLPRDAEATRKVSGDLRRVRRHGFRYRLTRDPHECRDFYDQMYLPYMLQTFGDCAELASCETILRQLDFSDLLLVENNDGTIAGQLLMYYDAGSCLGVMGVRDGNREYVKAGAACALYQFGLQHLQDMGRTKAGLGWSRPFLRDGVLQFKRKWSQRIVDSATGGFAMKILAQTPAVRSFLVNNAFAFKRDGKLHSAVFLDDAVGCDKRSAVAPACSLSADHAAKLIADYFHDGMTSLVVHDDQGEHVLVPSEEPARADREGIATA